MAAPRGHIKIARKAFTDDKWWKEKRAYSKWEAWVDMIQLAQWKATEITTTKFGSIRLERGEFVLSLRAMAKRWGWSIQSVRTFTESPAFHPRLATQRVTPAGIVYLVVNYDLYQSSEGESTQVVTQASTQDQHRTNTRTSSKAVKQVKQTTGVRSNGADPEPGSETKKLSKPDCDAFWQKWGELFGPVKYGRFRKALLVAYEPGMPVYTRNEILDAIQAAYEWLIEQDDRERGFFSLEKSFVGQLANWVRFGRMPLVEAGDLTERGAWAGSKAIREASRRPRAMT